MSVQYKDGPIENVENALGWHCNLCQNSILEGEALAEYAAAFDKSKRGHSRACLIELVRVSEDLGLYGLEREQE